MTDAKADELDRLKELVEWQRTQMGRIVAGAAARSVTDLASGMLMERLMCSAADAEEQLSRLADVAGVNVAQLASEIVGLPPPGGTEAATARPSLGWASLHGAEDAAQIVTILLDQGLSAEGATAAAVWLLEPDGGLQLGGETGFGALEASRWRRIPPGFRLPAMLAAREHVETWWPQGRPPGDATPLIGSAPGGARIIMPLQRLGVSIGALEISWPAALEGFSAPLQRKVAALVDGCAQALSAVGGGLASDYSADWFGALVDVLLDAAIIVRPIRNDDGTVRNHDGTPLELMIDWASQRYLDPAGHRPEEIAGRPLLEIFPDAAQPGGLADRALQVLSTGQPAHLPSVLLSSRARESVADVRIAPVFDGVLITWREAGQSDRLAALLEQAESLGRIGAWQEDLVTGQVIWTDHAYALAGQPRGKPVRLAEMHEHVPSEDAPAVLAFREKLLSRQEAAAAAFRIVRADDGSVRQLRAVAQPIIDPAGELIGINGAYQDISAQFHTQVAFDVAREQLSSAEDRAVEEHKLALRLQRAITPQASHLVEGAGLDVAARYRPSGVANLVSGDWYDAAVLPDKRVLLAIGDIAGHGLDAVTGMVALRNYLRGLAITGAGPGDLLGWLNSAACDLTDGIFATAICALYEPDNRTLRWARAGHLPPLLIRTGRASTPVPPKGLMLGADPETSYGEARETLQLGDVLLLFTDGLIERRGVPLDVSVAELARHVSRPVPDISDLADELMGRSSFDTDDDACLLAVAVR